MPPKRKQGGGKKPQTQASKAEKQNGTTNGNGVDIEDEIDAAAALLQKIELENAKARSVAGVLGSHPKSLDLKVDLLTITFHGREIVSDTTLEINQGRRYGLIGLNGSGKSTLLQAIYAREMPIPDHFDMFMVSREMCASEKSALQAVYDVDVERKRLEALADELAICEDEDSQAKLLDVYERLDEMEADTAEVRAAEILNGLGFSRAMMLKKCKDFSGGWRMRIALARALYLKPTLLLLDEPTNHLDLDACVWLEGELAKYKRCLFIISHSQDFMNNVCTNVIHLFQKKLIYYSGNYDTFIKTRAEMLENQMKRYKWEQDQLQHMKDYVARFGHGSAKLARQAQSKEKTMAKMIAGGLTEKVVTETVKQFYFFDSGYIPPPVIMIQHVSFKYSEDGPYIYKDLDFGIDLDTRVALVGPNGAGKSTLLKLLAGDVVPTDGMIRRHSHCKIGRYHQLSNQSKKSGSSGNSVYSGFSAFSGFTSNSTEDGEVSSVVRVDDSSKKSSQDDGKMFQVRELHFKYVEGHSSVARVAILLYNVSDRPLLYKFKTDAEEFLTALPSAKGCISAHGNSQITLTWKRSKTSWDDFTSPTVLIETKFLEDGVDEDLSSIRLIATIDPNGTCSVDDPPLERIILDSVAKKDEESEMTITREEDLSSQENPDTNANQPVNVAIIIAVIVFAWFMYRSFNTRHLHEELPLDLSALEFMLQAFPEVTEKEEMRKIIGRYGLSGREQVCPMKQLSDGQRCRVSFAWLAWQQPHLLLLDEPTNHLDMESIDALAEAINNFSGGMILVSHDFRLVHQVTNEIWVCDHGLTKWDGDIFSYKDFLRNNIGKAKVER